MIKDPSSFLSTPVYTIAAGPERKEFPVHSGLLSANSETLRVLFANGGGHDGWRNSRGDRSISWEQWDEPTVSRFVQWLYTGEYAVPDPKPTAPRKGGKPHHHQHISPPATPSPPSSVLSGSGGSDIAAPPHPPAPPAAQNTTLDYDETFLAHAKLYALGHFVVSKQLMRVCVNRLASLLDEIRWIERCSVAADNFVNLARYVYKNTDSSINRDVCPTHGSLEFPGNWADLWRSFAAFNFERLDCPSMLALMAAGGDFVVDVSKKVMKVMRKPTVTTATPPTPTLANPPLRLRMANSSSSSASSVSSATAKSTKPSTAAKTSTTTTASSSSTSSTPRTLRQRPKSNTIDSIKAAPTLERKGSAVRLSAPPSALIEAMKNSPGLERKGSLARISTADRKPGVSSPKSTIGSSGAAPRLAARPSVAQLDKKPSVARLAFNK
ncbi:hypothetical protein FN846DRAFT_887721 [Sphaerosporella brunnea]|uniref:BTB domain-containing protein n=1 Tax=Sphaerosporella brunnea TaxID=1250544 RepID=A0A5J5F4Q1_9PEZI|nr:hypothetical protein FN846DRAFT_887721 [Sphaerosporella brunnea]